MDPNTDELPFTANPNVPQPFPAPSQPRPMVEPTTHLDNLDHKLTLLDQNLSDWHLSTTKRVTLLTGKIVDYAQYLEEDRRTQAIVADSQARELKAIEELIAAKVEQEMQIRRESESRMMTMIEERF